MNLLMAGTKEIREEATKVAREATVALAGIKEASRDHLATVGMEVAAIIKAIRGRTVVVKTTEAGAMAVLRGMKTANATAAAAIRQLGEAPN